MRSHESWQASCLGGVDPKGKGDEILLNKVELIRPVEACWACGKPTINRHPETNHPLCPKCLAQDKWRNHAQVVQAKKDLARERWTKWADRIALVFIALSILYVVGQLFRAWANGWLPL